VSLFREPADLPDKGKQSPLLPQEDALLDKLARKVVEKGMSVPAILFLESIKPLNFIGSQVLVFFEPIVQTLFNFKDYDTFRTSLEKRESVEILLLKIEEYDSVSMARDKRIKKYVKQHKKNWKWYQRYLGIFTPKLDIPEEVTNPPATDKKSGPAEPKQ